MANKRLDLYEKWVEDGIDKEMIAIIASACMQGKTIVQIAAEVDTTERNLHRLRGKHKAVSSALKKQKSVIVSQAQNALMLKVQAGDTTAIIYALKIYGGEFFKKDRTEIRTELSGVDGKPIEYGQVEIYLPEKDKDEDE